MTVAPVFNVIAYEGNESDYYAASVAKFEAMGASVDTQIVSDEVLFGVWNGTDWDIEPLWDYDRYPQMAEIEEAAKLAGGDYTTAKEKLLEYYKKTFSDNRYHYSYGNTYNTPQYKLMAEALMENMYIKGSGMPVARISLDAEEKWVSADVQYSIDNMQSSGLNRVTFMIADLNKDDYMAKLYSKDSGYSPKLEMVVNNSRMSFTADCDTYVKGGAYTNTNQPFEYMFSRCTPTLSKHTVTKSEDVMESAVFLTLAHHGATLVIDAIDPIGTLDGRVYEQIGRVFDKAIPYEKYLSGKMIEDVGVYYSLKSKFDLRGDKCTNHNCAVNTVDTLIYNHIPCGVTGGYDDISKYKIVIASCLTGEDEYDNARLIDYVINGGKLYISGGDNKNLIKALLDVEVVGYTTEKITYMAPQKGVESEFEYFTKKYPLHFDCSAPIVGAMENNGVYATVTLPYTNQDTPKFASIHSNPPGVNTDIPALIVKNVGKGTVIWSAMPIEGDSNYDYRKIFLNLLIQFFDFKPSVTSDAAKDIEVVSFVDGKDIFVSTVLLNEDYYARKTEEFFISVLCDEKPERVLILPEEKEIEFEYENNRVIFKSQNKGIFNMYKIVK